MKLLVKLISLFMVVLLTNGCQKKTGAPDQLQDEAETSEIEMYAEAAVGQFLEEIDYGIVNDNAVRVRDQPSLQGTIIGQLERGTAVSVLGRSQSRIFIDGYDSFWLRIRKDNVEGWSYGAYINLTNCQYDSLPVIRSAALAGTVDLDYPRGLPIIELREKEREIIRLQPNRFLSRSVEEYYNAVASAFELRQSLRPFFLNTIRAGVSSTDRWYDLNTSVLCDYIQSSYIDNISIGPLAILDENTGAFMISGFKKEPVFTHTAAAVGICIRKIGEDVDFDPLNGKTVIDNMAITASTLERDFLGDIDRYYSYMTRAVFKTEYSRLLEAILFDILDITSASVVAGTLTIPPGTTFIQDSQYREKNIQNLHLPESLTYIDMYAFYGNELRSIDLPENLEGIDMGAFMGNRLKSVIIPDSVELIMPWAFMDNELAEIRFSRNMSTIHMNSFENNLLEKIVIPDNIKLIHGGAFTNNRIVEITIGANVELSKTVYANNIFGEFDEKFCAYYARNNRVGGLYRYNENIQEWEYIGR